MNTITTNCTSCGGVGDHGYEEESGLPYTCHGCGGTGTRVIDEAAYLKLEAAWHDVFAERDALAAALRDLADSVDIRSTRKGLHVLDALKAARAALAKIE